MVPIAPSATTTRSDNTDSKSGRIRLRYREGQSAPLPTTARVEFEADCTPRRRLRPRARCGTATHGERRSAAIDRLVEHPEWRRAQRQQRLVEASVRVAAP